MKQREQQTCHSHQLSECGCETLLSHQYEPLTPVHSPQSPNQMDSTRTSQPPNPHPCLDKSIGRLELVVDQVLLGVRECPYRRPIPKALFAQCPICPLQQLKRSFCQPQSNERKCSNSALRLSKKQPWGNARERLIYLERDHRANAMQQRTEPCPDQPRLVASILVASIPWSKGQRKSQLLHYSHHPISILSTRHNLHPYQ